MGLPLQELVQGLFGLAQGLVFASVLFHWLGLSLSNPMVRIVRLITEPMYKPARLITESIPGPFDWAPMLTLFGLITLQRFLMSVPF